MDIQSLLLQNIIACEQRIAALVRDEQTAEFWGLGNTKDFQITMGADIESLIQEVVFSDAPGHPVELRSITLKRKKDIIEKIFAKAATPYVERNGHFDGGLFEVNPVAGTPRDLVERYNALAHAMKTAAQKKRLNFRMGQGHWHLSLQNAGVPLAYEHPLLFHLSTTQLLDQITLPALFIKPHQAEWGTKAGTQEIFCGFSGHASICRDWSWTYSDGSPRYEMRLAHLAPGLPVFLTLFALERTLTSRPQNIADCDDNRLSLRKDEGYSRPTFNINLKESFRVKRGPCGYREFLEKTFNAQTFAEFFPELQHPLKIALLKSYDDFLRSTYEGLYTDEQRSELSRWIALQIDSLQGNTPPKFQKTATSRGFWFPKLRSLLNTPSL